MDRHGCSGQKALRPRDTQDNIWGAIVCWFFQKVHEGLAPTEADVSSSPTSPLMVAMTEAT